MGSEQFADLAIGLMIVSGAILALRIVLQRFGLAAPSDSRRHIRVVESKAIAGRSRLHLVEVDGERLLLGSGDQGVTLLRDCGSVDLDAESPKPGPTRFRKLKLARGSLLLAALIVLAPEVGLGQEASRNVVLQIPDSLGMGSSVLDMLALLTVLAIAPSILLMATCFTRFVIVLAFVRQALGLQNMPPNQVLIGLALFLTAFVMQPVAEQVMNLAYEPYVAGELSGAEALKQAVVPVREFLMSQTREEDLALFMELGSVGTAADLSAIPLSTLLPSFLVSELRTAFEIGFVVFLPFLVIDLVISSLLISMGMIVLPPIIVSLPFKIMLFVLVDGWNLILGSLIQSMA